jgi:hypothetical protein
MRIEFATVDAFHPGRIALPVITGGDDRDQARDGDLADKVTRYRRTEPLAGPGQRRELTIDHDHRPPTRHRAQQAGPAGKDES